MSARTLPMPTHRRSMTLNHRGLGRAVFSLLAMAAPGLLTAGVSGQASRPPGVLYGTVWAQGKPKAQLKIVVMCPAFPKPRGPQSSANAVKASTVTDGRGGYTLNTRSLPRGSCQMRAGSETDGVPIEVFISDASVNYDLSVDAQFNLSIR
jgi:hypothetical protein